MKCCEIDKSFIRTIPFYLKVSELIFCIPIWICVAAKSGYPQYGGGGFINFCSTISFIETIILFFLYLFAKIQVIPGPWVLIEVISILSSAVFFLICLIIAAATWWWGSAVIAAAVFCGVEIILYAVEFFLRFKVMRVEGFRFTAHMKSSETTTTAASENPQTTTGPYIIGA